MSTPLPNTSFPSRKDDAAIEPDDQTPAPNPLRAINAGLAAFAVIVTLIMMFDS